LPTKMLPRQIASGSQTTTNQRSAYAHRRPQAPSAFTRPKAPSHQ